MTSIAPGVEQASAARGRSYAPHLRFAGYGLLLGFCLSRMGFSSYDELHRMFVFADLRLFWTFIGGTGLCMLGYALLFRRNARPRKSIHRGAVVGGL